MSTIDREKGKQVLSHCLKQKQNISIIEKYIYDLAEDNETEYNRILYQVVTDIKSGMLLKDLVKTIESKKVLWSHDSLKSYIYEENEQNNFIITPFQIEEGIAECKCGSKRVFSYQKQSRSCDEPSTSYFECVACKKKWSYSG